MPCGSSTLVQVYHQVLVKIGCNKGRIVDGMLTAAVCIRSHFRHHCCMQQYHLYTILQGHLD